MQANVSSVLVDDDVELHVLGCRCLTELSDIPEDSFQQCIEAWQRKMENCIRLEGDYFEGETM